MARPATQPRSPLRRVLDEEFMFLTWRFEAAKLPVPDFSPDSSRAKFLDTSPGHYSRIMTQPPSLTEKTAEKWATLFLRLPAVDDETAADVETGESEASKGQVDAAIERLRDRLISAAQCPSFQELAAGGVKEVVPQLFESLGAHTFLVVEYRDMPRANPYSPHPKTAEAAGEAIARGLCFAMVFPFGINSVKAASEETKTEENKSGGDQPVLPVPRDCISDAVYHYLRMLRRAVRMVHARMREDAIDAYLRLQKPLDLADLPVQEREDIKSKRRSEAAKVIDRRLVLYERNDVPWMTTGVQSRMFYVEDASEPHHSKHRVFEWVASNDGDYFAPRDGVGADSSTLIINPVVLAHQVMPIHAWWHHPCNDRSLTDGGPSEPFSTLPSTDKQLQLATTLVNDDAYPNGGIAGASYATVPWLVRQRNGESRKFPAAVYARAFCTVDDFRKYWKMKNSEKEMEKTSDSGTSSSSEGAGAAPVGSGADSGEVTGTRSGEGER